MGRAASKWVLQNRNIWAKGPAVAEALERHLPATRPLRRLPAFWVPSWGTACGVAEYTTYLRKHLPLTRISNRMPDLYGARLLHLQHEYSLFDEIQLTSAVQQARQRGIPVVITEHTVDNQAHAWEQEASALITLTRAGQTRLQARWPGKPVLHFQHGCPTWFPVRKQRRGKVIGAFGFLEHYKGFRHLLNILSALPGTELLLFSHVRHPEVQAEWKQAAAGLPVRHETGFLPPDEVATRLAAEADVLVFWYDEIPFASASGAVRVGLASGVPVLTSPTSWFEELRPVTFQPASLIEGVRQLLEDNPLREELSAAARHYCHAHSWPKLAEQHQVLWQKLENI
jgi:glycosyltransferase involved in cell wall biosynthesis